MYMYNEEQKTRFIRDYTNDLTVAKKCKQAFEISAPFESEWGADLCTRNSEELQPMVDAFAKSKFWNRCKCFVITKDYVKWCIFNHAPDACNGIFLVDESGFKLDELRRQSVSSPEHLQHYLNLVFAPEEKETVDNIFRATYWLAYMGVELNDIFSITVDDVELDRLSLYYSKRDVHLPLYKESIASFRNCKNLSTFYIEKSSYCIYKDRVPGKCLLRTIFSARQSQSIDSIRSRLEAKQQAAKDKTELRLNYRRVFKAGTFYRLFIKEIQGIKPDFESIVDFEMSKRKYVNGGVWKEQNKATLIRQYDKNYDEWKIAWKYTI